MNDLYDIQPGEGLNADIVAMMDILMVQENTMLAKIAHQCIKDWLADITSTNPSADALNAFARCIYHPYFENHLKDVLNRNINNSVLHYFFNGNEEEVDILL